MTSVEEGILYSSPGGLSPWLREHNEKYSKNNLDLWINLHSMLCSALDVFLILNVFRMTCCMC